ncbi:MAG: carboxypeptidase regulatory-like domain-containing protein [Halobacteriales archaeon]|nr:carboxypeptidase regulatory-like domain-containing protein [Halobacteriales archaeon]
MDTHRIRERSPISPSAGYLLGAAVSLTLLIPSVATGQATLTGRIEGTVSVGGTTDLSPTRVENSTDPDVCGTEHSLQNLVVSPDNRGVRHTIVTIEGLEDGRVPSHGPERLVIDNRDCQFVPHVMVATIGDTIVAVNSDSTLHNTHYYGPMRSNIALAEPGMAVARPTRRLGLVTVLCDVHGWMKAYIRIDPHHLHAVTDATGRFQIEGIPPGDYQLRFWHERLGERLVDLEIRAGEERTVDLEFSPPDGR